jgi:chromosome segregation ATPase
MDDEAKPYLLTEAAALIGVSADALRKRIARRKLRANRSNEDGLWRVWLTPSEIEAIKAGRLSERANDSRLLRTLKSEVTILRGALDRERNRADRVEAELSEVRALADQRAAELAEMRRLLGQAAGAAAGLQEAVKIAEMGKQDADTRARGFQAERDAAEERATSAQREAAEAMTRLGQMAARLEEAEQRCANLQQKTDEAERRATVATARMDRIQLARMDEARAAAAAARTGQQANRIPLWRRILGLRRHS